jgi:uncharacterized protein
MGDTVMERQGSQGRRCMPEACVKGWRTMEPRISLITLGVRSLERALAFYRDGLGFPTTGSPADGVIFFKTAGTRLALYPFDRLGEDVGPAFLNQPHPKFQGITLAHNVRSKEEVDVVLRLAQKAGGVIEKAAQDTFWGGYSGYFSDPDGYLWEVAWGAFPLDEKGFLVLP